MGGKPEEHVPPAFMNWTMVFVGTGMALTMFAVALAGAFDRITATVVGDWFVAICVVASMYFLLLSVYTGWRYILKSHLAYDRLNAVLGLYGWLIIGSTWLGFTYRKVDSRHELYEPYTVVLVIVVLYSTVMILRHLWAASYFERYRRAHNHDELDTLLKQARKSSDAQSNQTST